MNGFGDRPSRREGPSTYDLSFDQYLSLDTIQSSDREANQSALEKVVLHYANNNANKMTARMGACILMIVPGGNGPDVTSEAEIFCNKPVASCRDMRDETRALLMD